MIRSMTGFGEVQRETPQGILQVEIRTVNHRHFHTSFRLPAGTEGWEPELTKLLRERIGRGHVRFRLELIGGPDGSWPVEVDHERVSAYIAALKEIEVRHGLSRGVDLSLLARFGDIFQAPTDRIEALDWTDVAAATRDALDRVVTVREQEGEALARDLVASLDAIESALTVIAERAPVRLEAERDRLHEAVRELSGDVKVDEDRLAREIAYLAERWDINEEIVRLRSHLEQFRAHLEAEADEPLGKRLSFWAQEMHREVNTIGSKANDAEIAREVVEIKTAIEKIREQVENLE